MVLDDPRNWGLNIIGSRILFQSSEIFLINVNCTCIVLVFPSFWRKHLQCYVYCLMISRSSSKSFSVVLLKVLSNKYTVKSHLNPRTSTSAFEYGRACQQTLYFITLTKSEGCLDSKCPCIVWDSSWIIFSWEDLHLFILTWCSWLVRFSLFQALSKTYMYMKKENINSYHVSLHTMRRKGAWK